MIQEYGKFNQVVMSFTKGKGFAAQARQIALNGYFNLMDERLKKIFIGRAEGELIQKSFRREFIKCFLMQLF